MKDETDCPEISCNCQRPILGLSSFMEFVFSFSAMNFT